MFITHALCSPSPTSLAEVNTQIDTNFSMPLTWIWRSVESSLQREWERSVFLSQRRLLATAAGEEGWRSTKPLPTRFLWWRYTSRRYLWDHCHEMGKNNFFQRTVFHSVRQCAWRWRTQNVTSLPSTENVVMASEPVNKIITVTKGPRWAGKAVSAKQPPESPTPRSAAL